MASWGRFLLAQGGQARTVPNLPLWRSSDGVLAGGTEPRADGAVAAW
ncbi:MAG: hypothetical protein ACOY9Y_15770 [Bacillota bacterium]